MKKIAVIMVVAALALAMVLPAASVAQPAEGSGNATLGSLPVLKLPGDLSAGGPASPMGKPDRPPGQDKKPPREPEANKWAVVIGIADYQGTAGDLWHPDEDAKEMSKALINNYGFPKGQIKTLLNRKATAGAILNAIDWLAEKENATSTVVFFFSGHGYRAPDGEGWDADLESDGYDEMIVTYDLYGLPDGMLRNRFAAFETEKFALVFGQCYSGGMFDDDDDLGATGRVISAVCKADQLGWDYLLLGNTLFGYYFIDEGILQGKADVNGDGVSMEEALAYAYPRVTAEQPDSEPQIYDGFEGQLIP